MEKLENFTKQVKRDLLKTNINSLNEALLELQGFLLSIGKIIINKESIKLNFTFSSPEVARRVIKLLKFTGFKKRLNYMERRGKKLFEIDLKITKSDLNNFNLIDSVDFKVHFKPKNENFIKPFLRGVFLGSGYIRDPLKGYYLEFRLMNESSIFEMYELLKILHFNFKERERKRYIILYLQDRNDIKELLLYLGASGSYLNMLEKTIIKDMKNDITKNLNFEINNIKKTINSYLKAKDAIINLKKRGLINKLSKPLKEVAELRMRYPYSSLNELARKIGVTKSCINHRLRRLIKLYERYINEK